MSPFKDILDTPLPKTKQKIRKSYFGLLDFFIIHAFKLLAAVLCVITVRLFVSMASLFILMGIPFTWYLLKNNLLSITPTFIQDWSKASTSYDKTGDKTMLKQFSEESNAVVYSDNQGSHTLQESIYYQNFLLFLGSLVFMFVLWKNEHLELILFVGISLLTVYSMTVIIYCWSINKIITQLLQ